MLWSSLAGVCAARVQLGVQMGLQLGVQLEIQVGVQPGVQLGLQPGVQPEIQMGVQMGLQPGAQLRVQPGARSHSPVAGGGQRRGAAGEGEVPPSRRLLSIPGKAPSQLTQGSFVSAHWFVTNDTTKRPQLRQLFADPPPPALPNSLPVNDVSFPSTDHRRASSWRTELSGADRTTSPSHLPTPLGLCAAGEVAPCGPPAHGLLLAGGKLESRSCGVPMSKAVSGWR